jgi:hypothetical protein
VAGQREADGKLAAARTPPSRRPFAASGPSSQELPAFTGSAIRAPDLDLAALLSVSFQPLMGLERGVHVELPVHALLPRPKIGGRLRHRDYLGLVDLVRVPIGHYGRGTFVEDVLQPIGPLAVGEGDQEAVIMLGRDDRCLVRPARSSPDMADDRCAGSFLAR